MTRRLSLVGLALFVALGAAPRPAAAAAGSLPFHGEVEATWDNVYSALFAPPAHFEGGGPVTHMGNTTQAGTLTLTPNSPNPAAPIPGKGSVTITAANGDELSFDFVGLLYPTTGVGSGTFTFTGGTGRFAGATGKGTFYAVIDLTQPTNQAMSVVLDGRVSY